MTVPGGEVTSVWVNLPDVGKFLAWRVTVRRQGTDLLEVTNVTADNATQACDMARAIGSVPLPVKFRKVNDQSYLAKY